MDQQYLSKERLEELKKEYEDLKARRRIEVGERLKKAKEFGDLSENSEYAEAREEQAQVETRISALEDIIKNAKIIEKTFSSGIVNVGSTVVVEKNGEKTKFTIVGSNEADPVSGLISNESPLGSAFLEKRIGDKAVVSAPNGKTEYTIVSIE